MSQPPRPLSPWAARYRYNLRGREHPIEDGEIHSNIAPMLPRLDPILYADPPPDDFEPKTGVELDSLFVTEHWQRKSFRGLHSWQNGPMMSQLWFSSKTGLIGGGHRTQDYGPVEEPKPAAPTDPANPTNPTDPTDPANPADPANPTDPADSKANVVKKNREDVALETFHAERIQVNESGWFPFLRKDRWLDTVESDPFLGGGRWSVDNPKIWEVLSISIELFDRMLKAMVADRHEMLETILFGLLTSWESMSSEPVPFVGANYLLSQRFLQGLSLMQKLPNPIAFITQYTQADWNDRLINLMDHQTWAMVDRFRGDEGTWGVTLLNSKSMIVIDSGIIKTMMAGEITLAERCIAHFMLATTMMHEMFHSLHYRRKNERGWPNPAQSLNRLPGLWTHEPFVDEDGCTEIGFAAELRIFGGQFFMGPTDTNNKPFGAFRLTWPEPYLETIPGEECLKGHRSFKSGITMPVTRIPAIYASKMLSSEFWDDPAIPRKSDDYFHTNRIIISDTEYLGLRHSTVWTLASIESVLPTDLHPGEQELMTMWQERERLWTEKRKSWYPGALSVWLTTPWAMYASRVWVTRFRRSFNRRDEIDCCNIAADLVGAMPYSSDRAQYIAALPPHGTNWKWIYHCIGLLMLAALPIRTKEVKNDRQLEHVYTFVPSKEAQSLSVVTNAPPAIPVDERTALPSEIFDPLGRPGVSGIRDFVQEEYINVVDALIHHLARIGAVVYTPWLREIVRVAQDLRSQRRGPARPRFSWAERWDFYIPDYNNAVSKFQNGNWVTWG